MFYYYEENYFGKLELNNPAVCMDSMCSHLRAHCTWRRIVTSFLWTIDTHKFQMPHRKETIFNRSHLHDSIVHCNPHHNAISIHMLVWTMNVYMAMVYFIDEQYRIIRSWTHFKIESEYWNEKSALKMTSEFRWKHRMARTGETAMRCKECDWNHNYQSFWYYFILHLHSI